MNHLESLRSKGISVKIGWHDLIVSPETPQDWQDKIAAKQSQIIGDLMEEKYYLPKCTLCNCPVAMEVYPGSNLEYYECIACGDNRARRAIKHPRYLAQLFQRGWFILTSKDHGLVVIKRDNSVTIDGNIENSYVVFTLSEWMRIRDASQEHIANVIKMKRNISGAELVPMGKEVF